MLSVGNGGALEAPFPAVLYQLFTLLLRLVRVGCLLRPPNPSTSGRSRSNGSDCRIVRRAGVTGVNTLVAGLLGPGSPKNMPESRVAKVEFASKVAVGLKFGSAMEDR